MGGERVYRNWEIYRNLDLSANLKLCLKILNVYLKRHLHVVKHLQNFFQDTLEEL